jgi:type IV pilus assembly protein PilV
MHMSPSRQHGLTIIESMVALVVISIGLLGIAGLQLVSMKQNSSALQHSKAVWAGYSMADRIRSNFANFGAYPGIDTDLSYAQDCTGGPCNANELVTGDAAEWAAKVQDLPAGRGTVTGDATRLVVTVMWDDEGTGATGTDCSGDAQVDLACYSITLVQ